MMLVFGIHPRMLVALVDLPSYRERCKVLKEAFFEHVAQARLRVAWLSPPQGAARADVQRRMRYWSTDRSRRTSGRVHSRVVGCSGTQVSLDFKDRLRLLSIDKVMENKPPFLNAGGAAESNQGTPVVDGDIAPMLDGVISSDTLMSCICRHIGELRDVAGRDLAAESVATTTVWLMEMFKGDYPRASSR